jgi:hypothetical protein
MQAVTEKDTQNPEEVASLADTLDVLDAKGNGVVTLEESGRVVLIRKCTVRASGRVIEFLNAAFADVLHYLRLVGKERGASTPTDPALTALAQGEGMEAGVLASLEKESTQYILQAIAKYWEQLPPVVASLSDLTEEEYRELTVDDGILVLYTIWMVNKNFFSNRVRQLVAAIRAQNLQPGPKDGRK